jgi:hypothetical protein
MRLAPLAVLTLALSLVPPLVAQKSSTPDFSGTWVLDSAKSDFAGKPVPKNDTSKFTRVGNVYHVEQVGDFGPQAGGVQRMSYSWPVADGEVTNDLPQGATMHVKTKVNGDTSTFAAEVSAQGHPILRQAGRAYLSQRGMLLIREMDLQPMQGDDLEPIHIVLVYDKTGH